MAPTTTASTAATAAAAAAVPKRTGELGELGKVGEVGKRRPTGAIGYINKKIRAPIIYSTKMRRIAVREENAA